MLMNSEKLLPIVILSLSLNSISNAAETDHFTRRAEPLLDESTKLNDMANFYLKKSINKANNKSSCDEKVLYKEMQIYFANHSKGKLVKDILYTDVLNKRQLTLNESIYRDWGIFNGFLLGRKKAASSPLALSPMLKIGDTVIGVDKLEHMFGMGYRYFSKYHLRDKKMVRVFKNGIFKEKTFLGGNLLATGVFSYADLSANFNGMRFWNHILQRRDDIMGENVGPYVKCENQKFVLSKEIDFRSYIDKSMDESINCSKFARKTAVKKFKSRIKELAKDDEVLLSCPISVSDFEDMQAKYNILIPGDRYERTLGHYILNDDGIEDVSYFNEF